MPKFLRLPAVMERYGLPRSTLYYQMTEGLFPRPINLGKRAVGWSVDELDAWDIARAADRDAAVGEPRPLATHRPARAELAPQ